jgi:hypothetical protein
LQTEWTDLAMSQDLAELQEVMLVPWGRNEVKGAKRAAGLFDAQGQFLPSGDCLRWAKAAVTVEPEIDPSAPVMRLEGRYLYGGMLYGHFGHFLCESTARLWALAQDQGFDGVVWLPKVRMAHAAKLVKPYHSFFATLGFENMGLFAPQANTVIENLVIPEQGFGIGDLSSGRPQYRQFMRGHLGADIAAEGAAKLYISRSKLPGKRGSVLMETVIEARLLAEGYRIFHPQDHSLAEQIAQYKAARQIVALDGSALHLAAMVLDPACRVAIINRGPSQNIDDYLRQFEAFAGVMPTRIDVVQSYWFYEGRRVVKRETHALLDFPSLGRALTEAGFRGDGLWAAPTPAQISAEVALREARAEMRLTRYEVSSIGPQDHAAKIGAEE